MHATRRLLVVAGIWELAMSWASSFIGAWFWHVHTGILAIVAYYLIWFLVMGVVFGVGWMRPIRLNHHDLRRGGILVAVLYLGLLALLGPFSRELVWLVAALTGLSSGLYWLSLYAGATESVEPESANWYNAWIGILENVFAVLGPPTAAAVIQGFPAGIGFRVVFGVAMVILAYAFALSRDHSHRKNLLQATEPVPIVLPQPVWSRLQWGLAALGFRDGLLFFVPGLYLFIVTHSALWLGWYLGLQAGVQTLVFWFLARHPRLSSSQGLWWLALSLSVLAGLPFFLVRPAVAIFVLGILVALAYPIYKVRIEGFTLTVIQRASEDASERLRITSLKELWLNLGRMASFLVLILAIVAFHRIPSTLTGSLVAWPLTTLLVYLSFGQLGMVGTEQ